MKKVIFLFIICLCGIYLLCGCSPVSDTIQSEVDNSEESHINNLVGIYQASNWNGKIGTLILYKDGTCQYPTGEKANWEVNIDEVVITFPDEEKEYDNSKESQIEKLFSEASKVHKVRIMEKGLILHETVFYKVSN